MNGNIFNERINTLRYHLLPGKTQPDFAAKSLHDRAYSYWKKFWSDIYSSAGAGDAFLVDDFIRQDYIAALLSGEQIVGLHLYTLFSLDQLSNREHRYFKFYPPEFFSYMNQKKARYVMSLEFLTVDPDWRKSICGIPMGEILIGTGLQLFRHLAADAAIAPARSDNKVNQMAYHYGFDCFQADVERRNFRVDLIAGFQDKIRKHPEPKISSLISHLWSNREDHTGTTHGISQSQAA